MQGWGGGVAGDTEGERGEELEGERKEEKEVRAGEQNGERRGCGENREEVR